MPLPIQENVIDPLTRVREALGIEPAELPPNALGDWLADLDLTAILERLPAECDAPTVLAEDLTYAFAYLHGVADVLNLTMAETLDAYATERL